MSTATHSNGKPKRKQMQIADRTEPAKPLDEQVAEHLGGFVTKGMAAQKAVDAIVLAATPFPVSKGAELVLLDHLIENPLNPRQVFEGIEELAKSIKSTGGLLVPIIARGVAHLSSPGDEVVAYEIVAGGRRFRALQLLKKQGVEWADRALVDLRKLTDAQAAEAMMAENERANLKPLEEARGYQNMLNQGHTPETIATALGLSKGTVIGRLKLLELGAKAMKQLEAGLLTTAIATPLGRYPHALQDEALEGLWSDRNREGMGGADTWRFEQRHAYQGPKLLNVGKAISWLQEHFTKSLKTTPWDQEDTTIEVPADLWPGLTGIDAHDGVEAIAPAPACSACPKNSNNMPTEVAGENAHGRSSAGFCTLPPCFDAKWAESVKRLRAESKEKGVKVLGETASRSALKKITNSDSRYAKAGEVNHQDPKKRTWGQLLELANAKLDEGEQIRKVLAVSEEGRANLVEKAEVEKVLAAEKVLPKPKKEPKDVSLAWQESANRDRQKREVQQQVSWELVDEAAMAITKHGVTLPLLRAMVQAAEEHAHWGGDNELPLFGLKSERELETFVEKKATVNELMGLLYRRLIGADVQGYWGGYCDEIGRLAKAACVDLKQREKDALKAAKTLEAAQDEDL